MTKEYKKSREYFRELLKEQLTTDNKQSAIKVLVNMRECKKNVYDCIKQGSISLEKQIPFFSKENKEEQDLKMKKIQLQKDIENLNRMMFDSEEAYKEAKKQLIAKRKNEEKLYRQAQEKKLLEVTEKVKSWNQQTKTSDLKRQNQYKQHDKLIQREEEEKKKFQEQRKKMHRLEKQRISEIKIRQIEENAMKRKKLLKNLKSQSLEKQPLYIEFERKYKQTLDEKNFQDKIQRKNNALQKKLDHESIKKHNRQFLAKMTERKKNEQLSPRAHTTQNKACFSLYTKQNPLKKVQQAEKRKRRRQFQQKVRQIPVQIDEAKRVEVQIQIDKAKNPFKYAFLSQKSLNQFQIFGEFQKFEMKLNSRDIGLNYLEEAKRLGSESRVRHSTSLSMIKSSQFESKPQFRDYLTQMRKNRQLHRSENKRHQAVEKKLIPKQNKDLYRQNLLKKSEQLERNFQTKKRQLETVNNLKHSLKKQSEVSNAYSTALKAKLVCLQSYS